MVIGVSLVGGKFSTGVNPTDGRIDVLRMVSETPIIDAKKTTSAPAMGCVLLLASGTFRRLPTNTKASGTIDASGTVNEYVMVDGKRSPGAVGEGIAVRMAGGKNQRLPATITGSGSTDDRPVVFAD